MDPGPIFNCLKELNYTEKMRIAKVHPVVSLCRIQSSQYEYRGNAMSFKKNIKNFILHLLVNPTDMIPIMLVTRNNLTGYVEFLFAHNAF